MTQSGLSKHFFSVAHYNSQGSGGGGVGAEKKKIALQTQFVRKMVIGDLSCRFRSFPTRIHQVINFRNF